jgi:hypothetical protein
MRKKPLKKGATTQRKFGNEINITKSKTFTHFLKGKISFMPFETILIILSELEYLEGLVKLARRRKDEEA